MKHLFPKRLLSLVLAMAMVFGLLSGGFAPALASDTDPSDNSWDIPLSNLAVSCGDYEPDGGASEGPANLAVDNNNATMWHTDWQGTSRENHWFQFQVNGDYAVNALRYLPRQTGNSNGTITKYEIRVSDDGETFTTVAEGNWAADSTWKIAEFPAQNAKYVRLYSIDAVTDNSWVFASAAELRLTYQPEEITGTDKTALNALIAECELIEKGNYTAKTWQAFQKALNRAISVAASNYVTQEQIDETCAALLQAKNNLKEKGEGEGVEKTFHLDSGRKYFSKDWHIALLNELSAAGYTHLQLAFGNNVMRFLLYDMTIEANGTTYASDDVKEGIRQGNYNYGALTGYYTDDHALTEAEMDEIIAHGKAVGVEIIPHLNMPGHMSALLDAMDYIGIENAHFTGRVQSDSSVNLNNEAALNFMYALTEKYAAYFAEAGCKYFHIGADEYANDAYNGNMGFPSMGATLYQKFADFVNSNAAIVKSHGLTPRAWNAGIYYGSYTSEFDSDIEVNYWSSGWDGYTLAKASTLNDKGHGLINTNGDYYYILGKDDRFTPGTSSTHDPNLYTECAGYDLNRFMDGSVIEEPVGGMFCVWADYPGRETEQQVGAAIRLVLRAMALRMEGVELDGMDTSVVPGGFNVDGSINESGEHVHKWSDWTTTATCTEAGVETRTCSCGETETREAAALGHDYVAFEVVPPTCTKTGYTVYKCTRCDKTYKDDPVEPEHTWDEGTVTAPTCTEQGYTTYTCTLCGLKYVDESTWTDALGHDYVNGKCSRCDDLKKGSFEDVNAGDYFFDPVEWAVNKGITAGATATTFNPEGELQRAQFVTFLWRAAGQPEPTSTNNPFTDIAVTDWYYNAVLWAVEKGITQGIAADKFGPFGVTNRAQAVTFLWRYLDQPESDTVAPFTDVEAGAWYAARINWAVEKGVTQGIGNNLFGIENNCNRAQAVTFLFRAIAE